MSDTDENPTMKPEVNLTKAKELGKYSTHSSSGNRRPQEKSRVLDAKDVDIIRKCGGCGKNMSRVKDSLVCSCKNAIHCSKDCFRTSKHKCEVPYTHEVLAASDQWYFANRAANEGPSSSKISSLLRITKGAHHKILDYAKRGNPTANYVVGSAYMERQFKRDACFAIPREFEDKSVAETDEIAVKFLKVAAEKEVPEAMYCLFRILGPRAGLNVDRRVVDFWLDKAYDTGTMDYLDQLLETPNNSNFPEQFNRLFDRISANQVVLIGTSLAHLLMATRFQELKAWNGKTGMGKRFYGFPMFQSIMELIGEIKNDQLGPSFIKGERKTLLFISARPGVSDMSDKCMSLVREENNLKFLQGVKGKANPDYQLVGQTSNVDGRSKYLITCQHDQVKLDEEAEWDESSKWFTTPMNKSFLDKSKNLKYAGECEPCAQEAKQRLHAVSMGLYSISLTPILENNFYAARYAKEDGVIVQDIFLGYSKPVVRQLLQCLMDNPADLHPLAVAENSKVFWAVVWFWGSVYEAVHDSCDKTTLDAIYSSLGDKIVFSKKENGSALAAFPEAAAGEWRIACGNEDCVRVDHEVKMSLCKGCKVRRYCDEVCQGKDWEKHRKSCKAGKNQQKRSSKYYS